MTNLKFPWLTEDPFDPGAPEKSLAQRVREEVMRMILFGEIHQGERLSEPEISKRLGVSRVPVREALRSLEPTGLVTTKLNSGVFVRRLTPDEMRELYEMRALLDAHAARICCALPDADRLPLVKKLLEHMKAMDAAEKSGNTLLYYQENLAFHWETIKVCRNRKFMETYQLITQQLHLCRATNLADGKSRSASYQEHQALFEAIRNQDTVAAEQAAYNHANRALTRLVAGA
jgi:DNA-binding GntR family transcriptional regulator